MSDTFIRRDTCVLDVPPISVYSYDRDVISLGSFVISHRIVVTTIKHLAAHTLKFIQKKQGDEIIEGHLSFLNIYTEPPPDVNRRNPKEIPLVYLTTIDVLPAYATIFNLGFENISRAGVRFAWNIHQGNLCLRMYIDKKRVAECVEKADIDSANCETSSGHAAFISLYNALLRLTHPRHQQAIDSADRSFGKKEAGREDFDSFFRQVETARQNLPPLPKYSLSLDGMTSRLRPYQEEAVRFMMHRELSPQLSCFDHLYRNIFLTRGVYYYPFLGVFCKNKSEAKMPSVPGGILADEMGLGKTVEFLALTLCLTKGNEDRVDIEPDITANQQSDICPIRETVDDLVSSVVAATDGQMGLAAMRAKTSTLERRLNTCFDVKEPEGKKKRKRDGDSKKDTINCAGCGANCIKKKGPSF